MSNIILNADISENSSFESNLTKMSHKPTVLNADMSENSSFVSKLTKISQLSQKNLAHKNAINEPNSKQQISTSYNDTEIASNAHISVYSSETSDKHSINAYSKNNTHISVYSSETSDKHLSNIPINTHFDITNSNKKQDDITNRVVIDVAVLCQEYTTIETMCHDNIINLDEILITKEIFQSIFYPYHENFGLNKDFLSNNQISPYISFIPEFRSVNSKKFYLLEEIIANIERDLNISRNCFTKESLVELTNEIISIKSLCDINCCSVLASLSWQNILEIIKNYQLINYCQCAKYNNEHEPNENHCAICKTSKSEIIPICVVNIIFKTPTPGVKNTIIRFNYRITNL
jgi:hypothetical protein